MNPESRIFVAGTATLAGQALASQLSKNYSNLQTDSILNIDLQDGSQVRQFFEQFQPEYLFFMGAASAGINANMRFPADLFTQNALSSLNLFEAARIANVQKVFYLASSCIYPCNAPQPMSPETLGSGPLEATSEAYAKARIFGIDLARAYEKQHGLKTIIGIPSDIYGPEDDFHPEYSHVLGALIQKIHGAKITGSSSVTLWGSGKPIRDFIYSQDVANACIFLMNRYEESAPVNISAQNFMTIAELADQITRQIEFKGSVYWDTSKSDGAPVKTLDASKLKSMGWKPRFNFQEGLSLTYQSFCNERKIYFHA